MANVVIAAAGAFIGNAIAPGALGFLGLTGASAGWLAGSLLASAFAPTQRSVGPRLDDLKVSGSTYGAVLPYIEGHPRVSGQVVWASDKREIATTQRSSGKGGGGSSVTTFTYEVDVFILLTSVPCEALLKVFSGGDLVFNQTFGGTASTFSASAQAPQWDRLTFYGGGPSQMPDPDMEAAEGVNAPAYRGRAGVFIKSLKLGQSGQLPNLTFEIARTATSGYAETFFREEVGDDTTLKPNFIDPPYSDLLPWMDFNVYKWGVSSLVDVVGDHVGESGWETATLTRMERQRAGVGGDWWTYRAWVYVTSYPASDTLLFAMAPQDGIVACHHGILLGPDGRIRPSLHHGDYTVKVGGVFVTCMHDLNTAGSLGEDLTYWVHDPEDVTDNPHVLPLNTWVEVVIQNTLGAIDTWCEGHGHRHAWGVLFERSYVSGSGFDSFPSGYRPIDPQAFHRYEAVHTEGDSGQARIQYGATFSQNGEFSIRAHATRKIDSVRISSTFDISNDETFEFGDSSDLTTVSGYVTPTQPYPEDGNTVTLYQFDEYPAYSPIEPSIADVVERLCVDCAGMPEEWVDVSDLEDVETPVFALTVSQVSAPRVTLEMLMGCYFFEAFLRGNVLHFRKRAGAAVATIPYEDLGWHVQGQRAPQAFGRVAGDSLPLPVQIALAYSDVLSDHQTDTQFSSRVEGAQGSVSVFQVPLGLTPSVAKKIAEARLADMYAALRTAHISLSLAYSRYEPTDVFIVASHDGSQFRMRSTKRVDAESVIDHDLVLDDATVFEQLGLTVGGTGAQTVVLPLPYTLLLLLDIPLLRDADDTPGIYVAVKGSNDQWRTADVFDSTDSVNYTYLETVTGEAVFGTCVGALQDWTGGTVLDEFSSVVVNVDRGTLSSITYDEMLLNVSVNVAVIGDELVQYRTATLVSEGVYKLTGLLRGRRGTEWAMVDHVAGERFAALGTVGMRFRSLQASDLTRDRYFKAASGGQQLSAAIPRETTPVGVNLEPFSPVGLAANRDDPTVTVLSWIRRTRLSTRVGGPLAPVIPLGEATEEYLLEIFDGTTIVRTVTTTEPEFEYTDAMQTADFGSMQFPITFRVRQVSATVGPGYPAEASV